VKLTEDEAKADAEYGLTTIEKGEEETDPTSEMPCSAVTLSLATITGIIATALLAIAFSTDNWLYTEVKRAQIQVRTRVHAWYHLFFSDLDSRRSRLQSMRRTRILPVIRLIEI